MQNALYELQILEFQQQFSAFLTDFLLKNQQKEGIASSLECVKDLRFRIQQMHW